MRIAESNHAASMRPDAVLENCIFYISPMYEFSHSQGHIPPPGVAITAGFLFDVPVRFDTDFLEVDWSAFAAGAIPKIPLIEIRP